MRYNLVTAKQDWYLAADKVTVSLSSHRLWVTDSARPIPNYWLRGLKEADEQLALPLCNPQAKPSNNQCSTTR